MVDAIDVPVVGLAIGDLVDESDELGARSLPHCAAAAVAPGVVVAGAAAAVAGRRGEE